MIEHFDYLERVAASLRMGKAAPVFPAYPAFQLELDGFVEPKERHRTGRSGQHYTPADTRRYEAYVKEAALNRMRLLKLKRFDKPVAVHLEIMDQIAPDVPAWKRQLMEQRLFFEHTGGDLDNKEKAILDAFNRVVYRDDSLVVQVFKFRRYAPKAGFKVVVAPHGLTKVDLGNIEKLLAFERANGQKESSERTDVAG